MSQNPESTTTTPGESESPDPWGDEVAKRQGWWPLKQAMNYFQTRYDQFPSDKKYSKALTAAAKRFGETSAKDFAEEADYVQELIGAGKKFMIPPKSGNISKK